MILRYLVPRALALAALAALAASPASASECVIDFLISQSDVDAVPPECTTVLGSIKITGAGVYDLTPLSAITSIDGSLDIDRTALTSLDGFDALTSVGGTLTIWNNASLTSIGGFGALTSIGSSLRIRNNSALTSVGGLGALTSVGDDFWVEGNGSLTTLGGLGALESVGDYVLVSNNNSLTSLDGLSALESVGFSALEFVGGYFSIKGNRSLASLDLSALTSVAGRLDILDTALTSLDLGALTSVGAVRGVGIDTNSLSISGNSALTSLDGFNALTSVGGALSIANNASLTSIGGFNALTSVDLLVGNYGLNIGNNASLTSIDGFNALTSIGGQSGRAALTIAMNNALPSIGGFGALTSVRNGVTIQSNRSLTSLDGLGTLTSVGGYLEIRYNTKLFACALGLRGLVSGEPPAFTGVEGQLYISDNARGGGCASPAAVLAAVAALPPPALACSTDAPLSFDFDGSGRPVTAADFNSAGSDATYGEFAGLRNESTDTPVDLSGCSFVSFDPFTESVTYAAAASGSVDADASYVFATTNGDQAFGQSDVLSDSPGAFALVTGEAAVGQDVTAFGGRVVAAVVYDRGRDVYGSVGGNATPAEQQAFALAMADAFGGGAVASEEGLDGDLAVSVWPNPSARRSTVAFGVSEAGPARVSVVDALGREVAVLADGAYAVGRHEATVEGSALPAGVYVVRVAAGGSVRTARLTVAR